MMELENHEEVDDIQSIFDEFNDEYLEFEKIKHKRSRRSDLHAFLLLDELFPSDRDIVAAAEHDKIYLDISPEELVEHATKTQIKELVRCGVLYDSDSSSLYMWA